jgi:prepilin signal peptidase PulO-like enzyme (type II secretory pathway)
MIMLMEHAVTAGILAVFGLLFGSFAGASVWRLRAAQLVADKKAGEKIDEAEYKRLEPLTKEKLSTDRSRCLHCQHILAWYDLLPLVSWLSTAGRCRYCRKSIGRFEPLIEVAVAAFFIVSYLLWPVPLTGWLEIVQFGLWLAAGVGLAILFSYDQKWFLLPDRVMFTVIGIAAVFATIAIIQAPQPLEMLLSTANAILILSGLYLLLWVYSKGSWIGFGDVKLGLALALLLVDWKLAFIALFAANLIGCLIVLPGLLTGRLSRTARVPFGPLLILGTIIAAFAGNSIIDASYVAADWYYNLFL